MSYCDALIAKDIKDVTCASPAVKGFERLGVIVNRADIDFASVTFGTTAKNVLTALPLKSGKKGFKIEQSGATPFTGTTSSAEVGTYRTSVNNNVTFVVLNNDAETADKVIDPALGGEFVVVLEMKDKGDSNKSAFRVYGLHNGLALSAYEHDPYGDAFAGGVITLTEQGAPMSAVYLGESYTAGKALFDSLLETAE